MFPSASKWEDVEHHYNHAFAQGFRRNPKGRVPLSGDEIRVTCIPMGDRSVEIIHILNAMKRGSVPEYLATQVKSRKMLCAD
jgi:hypothetical protein